MLTNEGKYLILTIRKIGVKNIFSGRKGQKEKERWGGEERSEGGWEWSLCIIKGVSSSHFSFSFIKQFYFHINQLYYHSFFKYVIA